MGSQKKVFGPFGPQFGLKISGGGGGGASPPGPYPGSATGLRLFRGTKREYSLKSLKHSIVERILVLKR